MATVICPVCGYPNRQESLYCVNCRCRLGEDPRTEDGPRHRTGSPASGWVAPVMKGADWCLIDESGSLFKKLPFKDGYSRKSEIDRFHEGYARVRDGGGYGYIGSGGTIEIPAVYDAGRHFSEGMVAVKQGLYWAYLDQYGLAATPYAFSNATEFREGLAAVQVGEKWGYIDHSFNYVFPAIFDYATPFSGGLAAVEYGWGWGYIDKEGHAVIPEGYRERSALLRFMKNQACALAGKAQLLDTEGNVVSALPFHRAYPYSEGVAAVEVEKKSDSVWKKEYEYRYVDRQGEFLKLRNGLGALGRAGDFSEGYAAMSPGRYVAFNEIPRAGTGGLGYYDLEGRCICTPHLDVAFPFREGLAKVAYVKNGVQHCGFLDRTGKMAMDYLGNEFTVADSFSHGLAPVGRMEGNSWKYGFVNRQGKEAIPFQFGKVAAFGN